LIVDDTPTVLDVVRELLEGNGYEVATCLVSRKAMAMARRFGPDLVMLDIVMPELSGWDLFALLRADPAFARVPIVVCTAWAEEAAGRMRELQAPDLWLLPKPFDADDLFATVTEALEATGGSLERPDHAGG
jgi:twitching motility two-component system response regulator PilH